MKTSKWSKLFDEKFLFSSDNDSEIIPDILLDADILVSLSKIDDSNHKLAVKIMSALQTRGAFFHVSPFTIAEATTVLSYKVSQKAAKKFLRAVRHLNLPVIELPKEKINLVDEWFLKQNKKRTSFFDCYNMAILQRYRNFIIFSFDQIYKRNQLPHIPTKV